MTAAQKRYLKLARMIDAGKLKYIAPRSIVYQRSPISRNDCAALEKLAGETVWFDDLGLEPTTESKRERVLFLCFAATK